MNCPKCERELPNKEWLTKDGCIWCDENHYNCQGECILKEENEN